jgi:hypothetical protein
MSHFDALDQLLCMNEEQYYAEDIFIDVEELIEQLAEQDIQALLTAWSSRSHAWRERFAHGSKKISRPVLQSLLRKAISEKADPEPSLSLITNLPRVADKSEFNEMLVGYAVSVWEGHPNLHRQVQMSTWSCGLSGRVLRALGKKSWKEAGL